MRPLAPVLLAVLALALGACGTSDDREEARGAVERFYAAIDADDGDAACAELGEPLLEQVESQTQRSCGDAITGFEYEPGDIVAARVFVTNAKVDLRSGESAFLSRERNGWKLSAIACRPERGKPADRPFECEVES